MRDASGHDILWSAFIFIFPPLRTTVLRDKPAKTGLRAQKTFKQVHFHVIKLFHLFETEAPGNTENGLLVVYCGVIASRNQLCTHKLEINVRSIFVRTWHTPHVQLKRARIQELALIVCDINSSSPACTDGYCINGKCQLDNQGRPDCV